MIIVTAFCNFDNMSSGLKSCSIVYVYFTKLLCYVWKMGRGGKERKKMKVMEEGIFTIV